MNQTTTTTISVSKTLSYYGDITREILEEVMTLHQPTPTEFRFQDKVYGTTIGDMDKIVYDVEKHLQSQQSIHEMFDDMIDVYYNGQ